MRMKMMAPKMRLFRASLMSRLKASLGILMKPPSLGLGILKRSFSGLFALPIAFRISAWVGGGSMPDLLVLWPRASSTEKATSSGSMASLPLNAARALAAFTETMSGRKPSTLSLEQVSATMEQTSRGASISGRSLLASSIPYLNSRRWSACLETKPAGSKANSSFLSMTMNLSSGSSTFSVSAKTPNLSRIWGLSSPSSGFMVPTRMKRDGCWTEKPSLST